jgi:integrase
MAREGGQTVRVNLRGIHSAIVKLASGKRVTYWYAWRKGPRLVGEPGSPEFIASYTAAHASRREPDGSRFHSIIAGYKASQDFAGLEPRTKSDYLQHVARIEQAFGDMPLAALEDARVTRDFIEWRDGMAHSPRQADYGWMVLMRLLSWARARGITFYRPPERIERLYHADRSEKIWEEQHLAAFMAVASEPLRRALVLALETGQRQGDLLRLPWSAYDGIWIRLRQSKNGRPVNIPATRVLQGVLANTKPTATVILTNKRGMAWAPNAFRKQWGDACRKAGITGLTFHDLRGTAVTRLAEAGCSAAEIASISATWGQSWTCIWRAPARLRWPPSPSWNGERRERKRQSGLQNAGSDSS